jgi:hypothetical protein
VTNFPVFSASLSASTQFKAQSVNAIRPDSGQPIRMSQWDGIGVFVPFLIDRRSALR